MSEPDRPLENPQLQDDLGFAYRIVRPANGSSRVIILLHGSGPDETSMIPLGHDIDPQATLISVRGRIIQDENRRWFTRITPTRFHQYSIRSEVGAFARFIKALAKKEAFDPAQAVLVGYSNGANLVNSLLLLNPGIVRRVALLRSMPVLRQVPDSNLTQMRILVICGSSDETYGPFAEPLASLLRHYGAEVSLVTVPEGHEFGRPDADAIKSWLDAPPKHTSM
jgi:phospholipase/carboxylesterase